MEMVSRDIAAPVLPTVNWTRCVVGGSHALREFLRVTNPPFAAVGPSWEVGDIDIHCATSGQADFLFLREFSLRHHRLTGEWVTTLKTRGVLGDGTPMRKDTTHGMRNTTSRSSQRPRCKSRASRCLSNSSACGCPPPPRRSCAAARSHHRLAGVRALPPIGHLASSPHLPRV